MSKKTIVVIANHDEGKYFFSTNHCQNHGLSEKYVPVTHYFPREVAPRKELPTGKVDNVKDIVLVFYNDMVEIPNPNPEFQPRIVEIADDDLEKTVDLPTKVSHLTAVSGRYLGIKIKLEWHKLYDEGISPALMTVEN